MFPAPCPVGLYLQEGHYQMRSLHFAPPESKQISLLYKVACLQYFIIGIRNGVVHSLMGMQSSDGWLLKKKRCRKQMK